MRLVAATVAVAGALLSAPAAHGQTGDWVWVGGSDLANTQPGVYGTQGVAAPNNIPGSRSDAASATDGSGNFWLFGGNVGDSNSTSTNPNYNDLWEFTPATQQWTWQAGGNTVAGSYGTLSVASGGYPGGRSNPVLWTDHSGNLWLFGGYGSDSNGTYGFLNDLWKFDVATADWTWMGGSSILPQLSNNNGQPPCEAGSYGVQNVASSSNSPGGRVAAVGWTGGDGNLWLFSGSGCASMTTFGYLNDLWEFNLATGEWTWVSGSNNPGSAGDYGTLGTPSANSAPPARDSAANLGTDSSGNLWLFGGLSGVAIPSSVNVTADYLNDLWEFSPASNQWTWQSGSATLPQVPAGDNTSQPGIYGTKGQYAAGNVPGGRTASSGFIDGKGIFWLFGGALGDASGAQDDFNDLWAFDPALKQWAWMSGSDTFVCQASSNGSCTTYGAPASYGSRGVAAVGNVPGSRLLVPSWTDRSGNLWIFGGGGVDSAGNLGGLGDLWMYQNPAAAPTLTPVFGTMTFSPVSTVTFETSQTITISDTVTYSGTQPTGAVTYVLNKITYTATCATSGSLNGSPETCTAQVPAATIAELPVAVYTVTGGIAADSKYSAAIAPNGTFTVASGGGTSCTVPTSTSNIMMATYTRMAEMDPPSVQVGDKDASSLAGGVSSNYVLPTLGVNGFPVYNPNATATSGTIEAPHDLLADGEISWWSPTLNNGGPNGSSDVFPDTTTANPTGTGVVPIPYDNEGFYVPDGAGSSDTQYLQGAVLTGTLVTPVSETVSFTISSDDMAFVYLDGQIACDDGGVHAATQVPCTTSTIGAGSHALQVFFHDLNPTASVLAFNVTTSGVGVGVGPQLVFGTMAFSPAATETQGTSQAITITNTVTFSGAPPTGAISFNLNDKSYPATCTAPANQQETCSAVVPAATIAALPAAAYPVTANFAGDCTYAIATASGTFTVTKQQVTFGTMTFSPVATVLEGTSQAITIADTLSFSGPQPTGAVTYVLAGTSYTATCTSGGSPETCSAAVPAATISTLSAQIYTVTGNFAGDSVYATAAAQSGTFTVTLPPPDFSITAGTLTLVTQHHGPTTVTVTPINGFTGLVNLSCGTVPAYVTCEWGPSTVDVSGGPATAQLTINTSAVFNYLASAPPASSSSVPSHGPVGGRIIFAALAFPAVLFVGRRRKAALRLMLCVFVLLSMVKLSGCSSHYPDSTPPGTYNITIRGTSGAIQHSTVLTLVVTGAGK